MHISSDFDGGNIICLAADDPDNIRLQIRKDAGGEFFQWFSFRLVGETGRSYRLVIENAGEAFTEALEHVHSFSVAQTANAPAGATR